MHAIDEDYVTVAEAATLLRVAPSTVRRWIREGDVPAYRIGRRRVTLRRVDLSAQVTSAPAATGTVDKLAGDEALEIRRLTPEEKQHAMDAMDRAQELSKRTLCARLEPAFLSCAGSPIAPRRRR
jgi:excisionase family DNA binding protein